MLATGLIELVSPTELREMNFPEDALKGRSLKQLTVRDAYFQPTSLIGTTLENCLFVGCRFERIEFSGDIRARNVELDHCEVGSIMRIDRDDQQFDPVQIRLAMQQCGFKFRDDHQADLPLQPREPDAELRLVERVMRIFLRANQVNEDVIRMKLGVRAGQFFDEVLPTLLRAGVLEQVPYRGGDVQRRFRLRVAMHKLQDALAQCGGDFQAFTRMAETH